MRERNIDSRHALVRKIAVAINDAGGKLYYVGGCVRDSILYGNDIYAQTGAHDIDLEAHGILPVDLENILKQFGEVKTVGKSFGVFQLSGTHDIDIGLPRKEVSTGKKHTDFRVDVDPFIGEKEAARRRDLTINSLMQDVLTGEVLDFYGGKKDLEQGILRAVDLRTFPDDPLRVFRVARFDSRFIRKDGLPFQIDFDTLVLCAQIDTATLSRERVMEETNKALMSKSPAAYFNALLLMGQLQVWFPELYNLIGVKQDPDHHPEGDAFIHTMLVVNQAASERHYATQPLYAMWAALCHDLGKSLSTKIGEDGKIRAIGHEDTGVKLAGEMLNRLTADKKLKHYVKNMVQYHMKPNAMAKAQLENNEAPYPNHHHQKHLNHLFDKSVEPNDLLFLAWADYTGRTRKDPPYEPIERYLRLGLYKYHQMIQEPMVTGDDLVELGYKPNGAFKDALELSRKLVLAGVSKEEALPMVVKTKGLVKV